MKKLFLAILVFGVIGFLISSFYGFKKQTVSRRTCYVYLIYVSGPQYLINNYAQEHAQPEPCPGAEVLCWICVPDTNCDGLISQGELDAFFAIYDTDSDGSIDDEIETIDVLEKQIS